MTTETDQTKIALIDNNIGFIQKDISEIKASIKELSGVYITTIQFEELRKEVSSIRNQGNLWRFTSPLIASVITAVITFLAIFYLQNLK